MGGSLKRRHIEHVTASHFPVLGGAGAIAAGRAVSSWLFGVRPFDAVTLATVVLVLLAAGLAAAWLPARRAARIDPLAAIRSEEMPLGIACRPSSAPSSCSR